MQHLAYKDLIWKNTSTPSVTKAIIVDNTEGGGVSLWRVPERAGFAYHSHQGYEYIYVISGCMDFSGRRLQNGDFLLTNEVESHEAVALETSIIMVISERSNSK